MQHLGQHVKVIALSLAIALAAAVGTAYWISTVRQPHGVPLDVARTMTAFFLLLFFWPMAGFWVGAFQGKDRETQYYFARSGAVVPLVAIGIAAAAVYFTW